MIETLRIHDLALVEELEIEFGPGLNVLTGETGAGKSIVLSALGWLAGGRVSADALRAGAEEARVEAVFRTDALPDLEAALRERGLESDSSELVVARSLGRSGRSRAQVGGRLVPVGTLAELFAGRLEVSSQHESQALRRPEHHARLLDAFGGLEAERAAVATAYAELRDARQRLQRLRTEAAERQRQADYLGFQMEEIDAAALVPGEAAALEEERRRLAHAEELRQQGGAAVAELVGDPSLAEALPASDLLAQVERRLAEMERLDPSLGRLRERLASLAVELGDLARELERYAEGVESDPERLARVEERLGELDRLRRKYGADEAEILAYRERIEAERGALEQSEALQQELEAQIQTLECELKTRARALGRGRRRAARRLEKALEGALVAVGLAATRICVELPALRPPEGMPSGPGGLEEVRFALAANPGEPPRPLHRIASGGELSRIFLALKNVLRRAEAGMVLVFDEVDAGIGGAAAERVGRVLAELARDHQVLCITHLPQIAAHADRHLRVEKRRRGSRTRTEVLPLGDEARLEELARMAGGERVTEATRRHARELLDSSGSRRRPAPRRAPPPPPR